MGRLTTDLSLQVLVGIFLMYLVREPPKNLPQACTAPTACKRDARFRLVMDQVASWRLAFCVAVSFATGCILSGMMHGVQRSVGTRAQRSGA